LYDPCIPLPIDPKFYEQALADIEFFSVSSQVYWLLKQQGRLAETPSLFRERLKRNYDEALYVNLLIKSHNEEMLKAFESAEITAIPLKGVHFAEAYFVHFGARPTSDIDLLIKPTDLDKAVDCVRSLGYTAEEERIPAHFHWSFSKTLPFSPVPLTVELHWGLLKENTSELSMDDFWRQAQPLQNYQYIKELSGYHTFYMICLHGWKHNLHGMKYFLDMIQMIHVLGDRLDYNVLFRDAASHKTGRRMLRTLAILYDQFPFLSSMKELPLRIKRNLWWEYEALRDSSYKSYKRHVNYVHFLFFDYDTLKHTLIAVSRWLLPPRVELFYELDSDLGSADSGNARPADYLKLYQKRFAGLFGTILTILHVKRVSKVPKADNGW
jgi:hypothetical protein